MSVELDPNFVLLIFFPFFGAFIAVLADWLLGIIIEGIRQG